MSEIILYTASDNKTQIDVQFDNETVWLNKIKLLHYLEEILKLLVNM